MITIKDVQKWLRQGTLDVHRASKATRRGHKHIHNEQFKSISHSNLTPAQYRFFHAKMVNGKIVHITKKPKKVKNG